MVSMGGWVGCLRARRRLIADDLSILSNLCLLSERDYMHVCGRVKKKSGKSFKPIKAAPGSISEGQQPNKVACVVLKMREWSI